MSDAQQDDFAGYAASDDSLDDGATLALDIASEADTFAQADDEVENSAHGNSDPPASGTEPSEVSADSAAPAASAQTAPSRQPEPTASADQIKSAFDALELELDTLAQRYEDGEISFKDYRQHERVVQDKRANVAEYQRQQEYTQRRIQQDWNQAVTDFMADDTNKIFGSPELLPMMHGRIQAAWQDPATQAKPYQQVLSEAAQSVRDTLRVALGIQGPPQPLPKEVADLQAKRQERLQASQSIPARGSKAPIAPSDPWEGYAAAD